MIVSYLSMVHSTLEQNWHNNSRKVGSEEITDYVTESDFSDIAATLTLR